MPMRSLLYHRGVDDHVGTYVTDYVYSFVCFLLCAQLMTRVCRNRKKMEEHQELTSTCWLPWNWPRLEVMPVTMGTYALLLFGLSNVFVTLLGGLTHNFVQQVEVYNDVNDVWDWLIIWRVGASFSAFLCLALFIMTEQLITQEEIFRIPRSIRILYYVIVFIACLGLFVYNYLPLTGGKDPFSIGKTFITVFAVMFLYGLATIAVAVKKSCCYANRSNESESTSSSSEYVPSARNVTKYTDNRNYREEIYSCCKTVLSRPCCHDNDDILSASRISQATRYKLELAFTVLSPWVFIIAGIMNYLLKKSCADSDDAYLELGCPLPNTFNHNALMHVIQIFATIGFYVAENLAITRRSSSMRSIINRVLTSVTIVDATTQNDVMTIKDDVLIADNLVFENESSNNNKPCQRDDVLCITSQNGHKNFSNDAANDEKDEIVPFFPSFPVYDVKSETQRVSMYDNLSNNEYRVV